MHICVYHKIVLLNDKVVIAILFPVVNDKVKILKYILAYHSL